MASPSPSASATASAVAAKLPKVWGIETLGDILKLTLHLLNWFALALAIISTIAVGVYYIAGALNESNVKKAKTLLAVTYTGLAIILLARLIITGPAFILFNYNVPTDPGSLPKLP